MTDTKTMTATIAQELADLRKAAGLSKTEAAAQIGKTSQTIANWETGKSEPTISIYNFLTGFYKARIRAAEKGE